MKLSNTMIMDKTLMPSSKKAFTLAEVLITLSILGVVAALTIPSLVNRQNELAAITKLKKAISTYESAVEVYMAETENTNFSGAATDCSTLRERFKMTLDSGDNASPCVFLTADGALWSIDSNGYAVVTDAARSPRYGVVMWAEGGQVNGTQTAGINGDTRPTAAPAELPQAENGADPTRLQLANGGGPNHGYFTAADMLNINSSQNREDAADVAARDTAAEVAPVRP